MTKKAMSILCVLCIFAGCGEKTARSRPPVGHVDAPPRRLISTVPSITEILFDIGVGDRLVGDSPYTTFPPEAAAIDKIGGLYDQNFEKIVSLRPDLVVFPDEDDGMRRRLASLGLASISVNHRTWDGILESYDTLGSRFEPNVAERAAFKRDLLRRLMERESEKARMKTPVRVLVCVDRSRGTGRLQNLFVAGNNPFFATVISAAGGVNVAGDISLPFPGLSLEGLVELAPEAIVDLHTGLDQTLGTKSRAEREAFEKTVLADWKAIGDSVPAVRKNRLFLITEDYATIPGPRTPLLVKRLADILDLCRESP